MKTALITGCSAGFGKITAELLADQGFNVLAGIRNTTSTNQSVAEELAKRGNIEIVDLDLASEKSITDAVNSIKHRRIDVLVNNAGVCGTGFAEMHATDKLRKIFDINVFGLYELTKQIIPVMRKQKAGLIISVTSIVGRVVMPIWGAYSASKFAVEALAETWKYELMPLGIDSIIVEPGPHPTTSMGMKMTDYSAEMPSMDILQEYGPVAQSLQEFGEQLKKEIESGTFQQPDGVAQAIAELIELPMGQRPMRTVVDKQLKEALGSLNGFTDNLYQQMYASS